MSKPIDNNLREYATEKEWLYYTEACNTNKAAAARKFGVVRTTVNSAIDRIETKAARAGYSPDHNLNPAPAGFLLDGYSDFVDEDGATIRRWNKYNAKKQKQFEELQEAMEGFASDFTDQSTLIPSPESYRADLINIIPLGDPHIGMYAWHEETGQDFDCEVAESIMVTAVDHLVGAAQPADTCLIINLGDFYHSDTMDNKTSRSGHTLDVDTRWSRVLEIGVRIMRRAIEKALERHEHVVVMNAIGNHDDMTSQFLSIVMREYFRNNPRVEIKNSKQAFQYHQFGVNLFGVTHGHTVKKPQDLEAIMARDCKDEWSGTERRKWFVGHFHSQRVHDLRNCLVEYYRNTAPADAWAFASGYRSYQDMKCETWHKEKGHVATTIFDPAMMA